MQNILSLTAQQILDIDDLSPEKLFSASDFVNERRRLLGKWHADRNTDNPHANKVFDHIRKLADIAEERIKNDRWNGRSSIKYTTVSGKTFNFTYRTYRPFELGRMYISSKYVVYVIDKDNKDLYQNGIHAIKGIKYSDRNFEKQFKPLLPNIVQNDEADIGYVVVMNKPKGAVLLQEMIEILPNQTLSPKHAAWVVSRLYNICMFLKHCDITHNAILLSTIFVDPNEHACYLFGGWWYSVKDGNKLKAVPFELIKTLPSDLLTDKIAKHSYDAIAIKAVGISCLGDSTLSGSKLLYNNDIPNEIVTLLRTPSTSVLLDEYKGWMATLERCWGERKFIKFTHDISQLY